MGLFGANLELPNLGLRAWNAAGWAEAFIATADDSDAARIYAASREFTTQATDDLPNTPFLGTLRRSMAINQSIVGGTIGFGEFSISYGEIELINLEGDYDGDVASTTVDGQPIVVKMGQVIGGVVADYDDFATVATLVGVRWSASNDTLRITVRDRAYLLDVPAQPQKYGGTGNLDGTSDMAGKAKPWPFGTVSNMTPAPVIPGEQVYQVSWRAVSAITAVYDGGFALTFGSDYATSTSLRSATVAAGTYSTCIAEGLLKLGDTPDKQLTVDVTGDNVGGYIFKTADVVKRIMVDAGGLDAAVDFDLASFSHVNVEQGAEIDYLLEYGGEETVTIACKRLMGGIAGWFGFDRFGKVYVALFGVPGIAAVAIYDKSHLIDFDRSDLPESIDPPPARIRVPYNRNWTVQTDLVPAAADNDPSRAAYVGQPFPVASTPDADRVVRLQSHPGASDPEPLDCFFAAQADATAHAAMLFERYDGTKFLYTMKLMDRLFVHIPGQTIFVTYPRYGLDDGDFGVVVQVADDQSANRTTLLVYI